MSRVKLNVGGEMMETTKETLTKFPNSRLAEMVNYTTSEDVLCLWLDLDPEYFRPILNWLRLGKLAVPSQLDMKLLLLMAEELGLMELSEIIKEKEAPSLGDWIKLNVGGTMFETSRATLTKEPDSLLGRMFDPDSSLPPAKIQDGAFLIDASPGSFPVILHWLRDRDLALGEVTVKAALSAAKYFGLMGLEKALKEVSNPKWTIGKKKKKRYEIEFENLRPQATDRVLVVLLRNVKPFVELPGSTLSKIMNLCDQDEDKHLDRYEFIAACCLADRAWLCGDEIPDQLPRQLSWLNVSRI